MTFSEKKTTHNKLIYRSTYAINKLINKLFIFSKNQLMRCDFEQFEHSMIYDRARVRKFCTVNFTTAS